MDPARAWSTILDEHPWFAVDTLLACCDQAIGYFEAGLHPRGASDVRRVAEGGFKLASKIVVGVAIAVISGYLIWRFGWT